MIAHRVDGVVSALFSGHGRVGERAMREEDEKREKEEADRQAEFSMFVEMM